MYEEFIPFEYGVPLRVSAPVEYQNFSKFKGLAADTHIHRQYEFLYVDNGTMRCISPDSECTIEAGDVLFINSHTPHSTYNETIGIKSILLQFDLPATSDLSLKYVSRFAKVTDVPVYLFKANESDTAEIKKCIFSIADEYYNRNEFWNEFINANLVMIMAILRRKKIVSDSIHKKESEINKIKPVIEYINENYAEDISTVELSKLLLFNESYFCRLFKKAIGTNAIEYLNFVRVCKAEHMLTKGMSISEIASLTGFSSLSYFNRIFKKYNTYSPSEYRKILTNRRFEKIN